MHKLLGGTEGEAKETTSIGASCSSPPNNASAEPGLALLTARPGLTRSPQETAAASSTRRLRAAGGELTPTAEGAQSHLGGSDDAFTTPGATAGSPARPLLQRPHPLPFFLSRKRIPTTYLITMSREHS